MGTNQKVIPNARTKLTAMRRHLFLDTAPRHPSEPITTEVSPVANMMYVALRYENPGASVPLLETSLVSNQIPRLRNPQPKS